MPTIDDVLPELNKARVFSTIDAARGFHNLVLDQESSELTTFATPFGFYRWKRLCFGISPAPEIFQARMHQLISGLNGVACIADDFLIYGCGDTQEEAQLDHDKNLIALLDRCRERNLHLNKDKLQIKNHSTTFMGHELTIEGLKPDRRKIQAIVDMPAPTDRSSLMRLLGMATYLAKFVPNFSEVTAKLRELLPRDTEFVWNDQIHGTALRKLKDILVTPSVLQYYDIKQPVVIQCDASSFGLGACLLQNDKPIEYASRSMTRTERETYAQIEKEMLAIVFGLNRFHSYVFGRHVTIETDHKPLIAIVKKSLASAPKRLQRMLLMLQRHGDFTVVYRPGSQLLIADTLSRAPLPDDTPTEFKEEIAALADNEQQQNLRMVASEAKIEYIKTAAAVDNQYQLLRRQISMGWPESASDLPPTLREFSTFADELVESHGLVFKGDRVVIPAEARAEILNRIHSSHIGINGCIRRAKEAVFYPGIIADIKTVAGCAVCSAHQSANQKEPLMSHEAPNRPWEKVGVDICTIKQRDYLVTVDSLSGYFEVDRLPSKRISDVIYCLKMQFARHGLPMEVVSDNSPFNASEFRQFAEKFDFKHTTSSPHYPQSNGRAEAAVKTVKKLYEKAMEDRQDPHLALLAWRNTPAEQLGLSPAQIMFGRRTRTTLPTTATLLKSQYDQKAHEALQSSKERQSSYYNRQSRPRAPFSMGDNVRSRWRDMKEWRKAKVVGILPNRSYHLQFEDGSTRRRTSRHIRFSPEPPTIIGRDDDMEISRAPQPQQQQHHPRQPGAGNPTSSSTTVVLPPSQSTTTTRSGRTVRRPVRFADYVTEY